MHIVNTVTADRLMNVLLEAEVRGSQATFDRNDMTTRQRR